MKLQRDKCDDLNAIQAVPLVGLAKHQLKYRKMFVYR